MSTPPHERLCRIAEEAVADMLEVCDRAEAAGLRQDREHNRGTHIDYEHRDFGIAITVHVGGFWMFTHHKHHNVEKAVEDGARKAVNYYAGVAQWWLDLIQKRDTEERNYILGIQTGSAAA